MRKTAKITIDAPGRDQGKTFLITEMAADQAEAWAMRALGAMARSNVSVPDDLSNGNMLSFAFVGLRAFMTAPWDDVAPLLDELMKCVQIVEAKLTRPPTSDDIEEIGTRLRLRDEVIQLHVGFSLAATLLGAVAALPEIGTTTQTSADSSEPSSEAN